jgi:hypothetical protein
LSSIKNDRIKKYNWSVPGPQINLIPGAWLFNWFPVWPRPFLIVCGLPLWENNLTNGCHGDSEAANFSLPVCSPTWEAGRRVQTGFFLWCAACHKLCPDICGLPPSSTVYWGANDIKYIYSVYSECEIFKKFSF